jgi:hypothetical protein
MTDISDVARLSDIEKCFLRRPVKDLQAFAKEQGFTVRIVAVNGYRCVVTQGFNPNRVNIGVGSLPGELDGQITSFEGVG